MNDKPIKRHIALQNLSREHHDMLVFVLRLKKGVAKYTRLQELQDYCDWFWEVYVKPHFLLEEENLFALVHDKNQLIDQVRKEHSELKKHFENTSKTKQDFVQLQELLSKHIRFEERQLYNFLQENLDEHQLLKFQNTHTQQQACGMWRSAFWKG